LYALQLAVGGLPLTAVLIMLGESIVIVHRGTAVTNFATAAIGLIGTYVFYDIWPGHGIPWPLALVIALLVSMAIGAAMHLIVMRRLRDASVAVRTIATLGLMVLLLAIMDEWFSVDGNIRSVLFILPTGSMQPFRNLTIPTNNIVLIGVALGFTVLLLLVQKYTRFGLATAAVCESRTVASGMGWSPDLVAVGNWALGSGLATIGIILLVPIAGLSSDPIVLLVVPALGAALIGKFDSIVLTAIGAIAIGVGEAEVGEFTTSSGWAEAAPLLIILIILVARPASRIDRSEAAPRLPVIGTGRIGYPLVVGVAILAVLISILAPSWQSAVVTSLIIGIALLSVVVLTGYAGQLSLAGLGLAGVSAFVTALFAARFGLPLWLSMILGVIFTIPVGLVVAIPAFRTRGPTLAIATLSMVVVIEDLLLTNVTPIGWLGAGALPPLEIFGLKLDTFSHATNYAIFASVILVLVGLMVANLRRSATGRRLLAIRTNPQAAASLGISAPFMKAYAFAVSTGIAAVCGALLESQLAYPDFSTFTTQASTTLVLQGVVGGVGFIPGAIFAGTGAAGGIGARLLDLIISPVTAGTWLAIITGGTLLLVLVQSPDGIMPMQIEQFKAIERRVKGLAGRIRGRAIQDKRHPDPCERALKSGSITQERRAPSRLDVEGLTVVFGGVYALDDVSLSVSPGEIVGLIGPNGAGKSTFIDAVCGNQPAKKGVIRVDGKEIGKLNAVRRARIGIGRSYQSLELFEDMTVGENILAASEHPSRGQGLRDLAWPRKPRTTGAAALAVQSFGLETLLGQTPRNLDHGKRRQVAIARSFATNPGVILLDEPAAGLDARERAELGVTLRRVASEWNLGILLVEHDVELVFRVCDRTVPLVAGRTIGGGTAAEVRSNPQFIAAYLGSQIAEEAADGGGSSDGADVGSPVPVRGVAASNGDGAVALEVPALEVAALEEEL
jgi:ABC-type branched-subunit amino acid transport system ATPase component/branched-subunit amino acid ABC-type transport system permease component